MARNAPKYQGETKGKTMYYAAIKSQGKFVLSKINNNPTFDVYAFRTKAEMTQEIAKQKEQGFEMEHIPRATMDKWFHKQYSPVEIDGKLIVRRLDRSVR